MATRDLKHIEIGSIKTKEGKKNPDHESRPRELSDSIKHSNICVTGVPEEEEIEKGKEGLFVEIMKTDIQIQEALRTPIKIQQKVNAKTQSSLICKI